MSETEPTIRVPLSAIKPLIGPIVGAIIAALLGGNLWQSQREDKVLTRSQAQWDFETATLIVKKLDRIEEKLEARP